MRYGGWPPYVPVAQKRANANREMQKLIKKGNKIDPVEIQGKKIAQTFWGQAWCKHLEKFSDYSNRLPRGRTYVRNGSVCHLSIEKGRIEAFVAGSELYKIEIKIEPLPASRWKKVRQQCAGEIGSLLELLQGKFSDNVMQIVTDKNSGLFPQPKEIKLGCNCPDWADLCKHLAAVLYGVGARLDQQPELLFLLRDVDHQELISTELDIKTTTKKGKGRRLADTDLSDVFGVEMDEPVKPIRKQRDTGKKVAKKKTAKKKAAAKKRPFNPTAAGVTRLRKRFKMTPPQFAKLIGVSPLTVNNWELRSGKLNLRQRTHEALTKVTDLTPEQADRKLKRINKSG